MNAFFEEMQEVDLEDLMDDEQRTAKGLVPKRSGGLCQQ